MTLLFEEATPFGLEIFVSVSIFSIFFDVHPDSIQTKAGPNNFCPQKCRLLSPLAWRCRTRRKRPLVDAPLKADSQVPLPRPAPVDVEGSNLDRIFASNM